MDLKELQANWNALGDTDPLWAILSVPELKGGGWDLETFFATGREAVQELMADVSKLRPNLSRRDALDFGCGVGRLTQALCLHFDRAVGVDIAPSMIELANNMNKHDDRCEYYVNAANDLRCFADQSFDLVLSLLVLQHMPPTLARMYIAEFIRVLRTGGVVVFQVPSSVRSEFMTTPKGGDGPVPVPAAVLVWRRMLRRGKRLGRAVLRAVTRDSRSRTIAPRIDMYGIDQGDVASVIAGAGGRILDVYEDRLAGKEWVSITYTVERSTS